MGRETNIALQEPDPVVIHRDHLVRVTNNHDETIKGRWNGRDFIFKTGVALDIPVAAAQHIFGFGTEDHDMKMRAFNGTGIMAKCGTFERSIEFMHKVKFAEPPALVEMSETDPRRNVGRKPRAVKSTDAHPSVNGAGETGGKASADSPADSPADDMGDDDDV